MCKVIRIVRMAMIAVLMTSCVVGGDYDTSDGDGDDGEGLEAEVVSPRHVNIGFQGDVDQFAYWPDWRAATVVQPGNRVCHYYFAWNSATDPTARAAVDSWLRGAAGTCDEVLIAFKSMTPRAALDEATFTAAFAQFVAIDWKAETGYAGAFTFSPWNEPNNPDVAGNGLGVMIEANLAARYYLAAEAQCRVHGCRVVAGDFATNGNMWLDLSWNCANDNVPADQLCNRYSDVNRTHAPASYLDKYKNEIAQHANDAKYGLGEGFRPEVFAYHGWHDTNEYVYAQQTCSSYDNCAVRRLLKSLGGSWGGVRVWDTEDGMGQKGPLDDHDQACGAAFVMRAATFTGRVDRVMITRLHGGDLQLEVGHTPRPAFGVLAQRKTQYAADCL